MPSMADRRKATDKRIYEAAMVEFGKNGYSNTTLSMIAKTAGITPGLIVQNFGSKEELFKKIAIDIVTNIGDHLKGFSTKWDDRCRETITFMLGALVKYPDALDYLNFYISLMTSFDTPDDVLKDVIDIYHKSPVGSIIAEGQKRGEVMDGDPYIIHTLFWTNAFNTVYICYKNELEYPPTDWFIDIIRKH